MKKRQIKPLTFLALIGACSLAFSIGIFGAYTVAAYVNIEKNNFETQYKTENIGTVYFDGGDGTEGNPYVIATASQLRNLQKLVSVGLFGQNTNFVLANDIAYDDIALLPIGTTDFPFTSTFDGKGHTISNLLVSGDNTWDIGMFGYVGINGVIKNFILSAPTIEVGANSDGGTADTTNPLAAGFETAAQKLAQPSTSSSGTGYLTWTDTASSATLSGLDTSVTGKINGTATTLSIDWESSNTALLSDDNGVWTTHANPSSTSPDHDLYPAQLTGRIIAEVNGKLAVYTLERYQVNVLGNGTITSNTTILSTDSSGNSVTVSDGVYKTIWPLDSSGGTSEYHKTYVGFFAGELDGYAKFLGLKGGNSYDAAANGKIVVGGRKVASSACLVGRSRSDNVKDSTASNKYNKYFDFTKDVSLSSFNAPATVYSSENQFTTQQANSETVTKAFLDKSDTTTSEYLRLFPSVSQVNNTTIKEKDESGNEVTKSNVSALRFNKAIGAGTLTKDVAWNWWFFSGREELARNFYVNNGIWLWSTSKANNKIATIFGETKFYITFRLVYSATTNSSNKKLNDFQILYNAYNPDIKNIFYTDSYLQKVQWYDLHNPVILSNGNWTNTTSQYDPVTINADGYLHEADITLAVDKSSSSFWSRLWQSWWQSDTYYPCFALGMGAHNGTLAQSNPNFSTNASASMQTGDSAIHANQFYNSYMSLNGDCSLNLYNLEVLFSNRTGNVSSLLNNVDYLYDDSNCTFDASADTYTNWNDDSGVKLAFDVKASLTSNASYYFYRGNDALDTVYGRYSDGTYPLTNTAGYKDATISVA